MRPVYYEMHSTKRREEEKRKTAKETKEEITCENQIATANIQNIYKRSKKEIAKRRVTKLSASIQRI